jgi:hypothetical protein
MIGRSFLQVRVPIQDLLRRRSEGERLACISTEKRSNDVVLGTRLSIASSPGEKSGLLAQPILRTSKQGKADKSAYLQFLSTVFDRDVTLVLLAVVRVEYLAP